MSCQPARESYVFIDCPGCGEELPEPFPRSSLHQFTHHRGPSRGRCRFVIMVDPSGENHETRVLDEDEYFEEVIEEMHPQYRDRMVDEGLAAALAERRS